MHGHSRSILERLLRSSNARAASPIAETRHLGRGGPARALPLGGVPVKGGTHDLPFDRARILAPAVAVALSLGLAACGGDDDQITSVTPPPDVAGPYFLQWTLQVLRKSDGFQKQFELLRPDDARPGGGHRLDAPPCRASPWSAPAARPSPTTSTAASAPGARSSSTRTARSRPRGPAPAARTSTSRARSRPPARRVIVSARGVTTVTCPQFGEHEFTYLINAVR